MWILWMSERGIQGGREFVGSTLEGVWRLMRVRKWSAKVLHAFSTSVDRMVSQGVSRSSLLILLKSALWWSNTLFLFFFRKLLQLE